MFNNLLYLQGIERISYRSKRLQQGSSLFLNPVNLKPVNKMEEIWKDVTNYEGLYQVSNLGRIKSLGNGKSNASKLRFMSLNKTTWI